MPDGPIADSHTEEHITVGNIADSFGNAIGRGAKAIVNVFANADDGRALRNRSFVLKKVRGFWIEGVLQRSVHTEALITIGMHEDPAAVDRPSDAMADAPTAPPRHSELHESILSVFEAMDRALLILGEPGSGKTITMLNLASQALELAEEDPVQPMPIVFTLSSWAERRMLLADWLVEELNKKYQIPTRLARAWVAADDLLLLLDGLDEVPSDQQDACVAAINQFREEHGLASIAVSCRVSDYRRLRQRLRLSGAIALEPLTKLQITAYLKTMETDTVHLAAMLQKDAALEELSKTPLMLNVMISAFQNRSERDVLRFVSSPSNESYEARLWRIYVDRMLRDRRAQQRYDPKSTTRRLSWLATQMSTHSSSLFMPEQLQPTWLQTKFDRILYAASTWSLMIFPPGIFIGMISLILLYSGLMADTMPNSTQPLPRVNPLVSLAGLALYIGILVLVCAIGGDRVVREVRPTELMVWSWRKAKRAWFRGMLAGCGCVPIMLIISVPIYVVLWKVYPDLITYMWEPTITSIEAAVTSASVDISYSTVLVTIGILLAIGLLINSMMFGVIFSFLSALIFGWQTNDIENKSSPNQGIWRSFRNGAVFGTIASIPLLILPGVAIAILVTDHKLMASALVTLMNFSLYVLALIVFSSGWSAVLRHFVLRAILARRKMLPWRLVRFLDYGVSVALLQPVGGGYKFIHRSLQDYFVSVGPIGL